MIVWEESMQIHELKFKKNQLYIISGVIFIVVGLIITIVLIAFITSKPALLVGTAIMIILLLTNIILDFTIGKYYLTLSSRTYIKISDRELEIDKGLARRNHVINFQDIDKACFIGEKLVLSLTDNYPNKEIEIRLNLMYLKDLDVLFDTFSKNNILVNKL